TEVKAALKAASVRAESFTGTLLAEPFAVETQAGDYYKVYTPYSRTVFEMLDPGEPLPAPDRWPSPESWPESASIDDLGLEREMRRGAAVVAAHAAIGERAARERLDWFLEEAVGAYGDQRDRMDRDGTSRLAAHFSTGELSPRSAWRATKIAMERNPRCEAGAQVFLKEIVWREFAWHLLYHTPHLATRNWREKWDEFPWREDNDDAEQWRRGRTGVPIVDAAMRELYVTGVMHNRARMLCASYLTKNLLIDWRVGEAWFRDCLVDWDLASNAMGWQWAAGSGPDAAPYFRIFNPETQAKKFDPKGAYVARWLPEYANTEMGSAAHPDGLSFFDACPKSWGLSADDSYPDPALPLSEGRKRALEAFETLQESAS
ncbi:MAG: deoxyribodipyrimidine photo-lyase, partial [Pseudomonadota bacterium]